MKPFFQTVLPVFAFFLTGSSAFAGAGMPQLGILVNRAEIPANTAIPKVRVYSMTYDTTFDRQFGYRLKSRMDHVVDLAPVAPRDAARFAQQFYQIGSNEVPFVFNGERGGLFTSTNVWMFCVIDPRTNEAYVVTDTASRTTHQACYTIGSKSSKPVFARLNMRDPESAEMFMGQANPFIKLDALQF